MKYIATQLDPSNGFVVNEWDENEHPNIRAWTDFGCGWRHEDSVVADDIKYWYMAESLLNESLDYIDAILSGKWPKNDTYRNVREFIHFNLPIREWNDAEVRAIVKVIRNLDSETIHGVKYYDVKRDDVCAVLSVIDGKHYKTRQFHGYTQSDWIGIAYAEEDWPNDSIGYAAADALGEYTEFNISTEGHDDWDYWCTVYDRWGNAPCKDTAEQLKDIIGLKPGDTLIIRTLNGSGHWTPDYDDEEVVVA